MKGGKTGRPAGPGGKVSERSKSDRLQAKVDRLEETERQLAETLHNLEVHQEELRAQNEELRAAQAVLQDLNHKYYRLFNNSPAGYFVLDANARITDVNFAGATLLGREIAHLVGKPLLLFVAPESRRLLDAHLRDAQHSGRGRAEIDLIGPGGDVATALLESCLLERDADHEVRLLVTALDISAKRQAERELEAVLDALTQSNQELKQFAFVASHDLQEPLRTVITYLQLLEKRHGDDLNGDAREFLGFAVGGAKRLRTLVQDLLAYSRVENRATDFEHVAGEPLLETILGDFSTAIEEARARVSYDTLPMLYGDRSQLAQVFSNLIGNALKYRHPERLPEVHLGVEDQGPYWIVTVTDNGIGIEPEYYQRIFLIFQRLHTQEHYDGTGIGLAICKKIVERHGGRIWVESRYGEGSRFRFSLPKAGTGPKK